MSFFVEHPHYILTFAGIGLLLLLLCFEAAFSRIHGLKNYGLKDTLANFGMYIGSFVINFFWVPMVYSLYLWTYQYSFFKIGHQWWLFQGNTPWWPWLLLFVLDDFCFYWFHRSSHSSRFLWASHVSHHSSRWFNLSVGFRQTWTPFFAMLFWWPLALIGFDPLMILTMQLLSLTLQGLLHTELIKSLGLFEVIFNTPSHHRVHHGTQEKYLDKNFAGLLIIWDRLFGTYQAEEEKPVYGVGSNFEENNLIRIAFSEWGALLKGSGKRSLAILPILMLSSGCEAAVREWQEKRLIDHLARVKNYHGVIVETGILDSGEDLVSEIWFEKPGKYDVLIKAPTKHAGVRLTYDGKTSLIVYPKSKFATIYRNLPELTSGEISKLIGAQFRANMEAFTYELGAAEKVAGYPAIDLLFESKHDSGLVKNGSSKVYDEFSFPLASELNFKNKSRYTFSFKEITFNEAKFSHAFSQHIPDDAIVSDWDMQSKGFSEEEAKAGCDFKFQLPKTPSGMKLIKIIRQKGPIPAFTAMYSNGIFSLNVLLFKDYGVSAVPAGRGIKIAKAGISGLLIPNPHMNSYSFVNGDTQYILTGNVSIEDLVNTASSLDSDKRLEESKRVDKK